MKPKLEHYPKWLREYLDPTIPMASRNRDPYFIETDRALHKIAIKAETDPDARIIFGVVLEGVRLRFKVSALEDKIERLESQVRLIKDSLPPEV